MSVGLAVMGGVIRDTTLIRLLNMCGTRMAVEIGGYEGVSVGLVDFN